MSVTISNCENICHAPTNGSPAKMLYSFPKQSRFLKRKTFKFTSPYPDAIDSMTSRIQSPSGRRASAMVGSMTSPRNCLPPRHPITTSPRPLMHANSFPLGKVG